MDVSPVEDLNFLCLSFSCLSSFEPFSLKLFFYGLAFEIYRRRDIKGRGEVSINSFERLGTFLLTVSIVLYLSP